MIFLNKYKKSEFLKNILTLFFGTSIAQIIPLMISPILSRMYSPDQFGQLGVLLSVIGIFSIIATFQYESAIMLPKKDEDAFNILILAILITTAISTLSYIVCSIYNVEIANLLKAPSFSNWVFLVPFFVLLSGLFNSLNIWTSRQKKFKRLAFRQIAQTTVGAGSKLVFGWLKYLNSGLVWGSLLGQVTSTGVLTYMTIKEDKKLFKTISFNRIKKNVIKYQDFPKYTMWQGFLDLVNASGVIFILSHYYGIKVVGLYSFSLALLMKPVQMIGQAISQVYFQNASQKIKNNESIYKDTIRLLNNLALISCVIFLPILIAGPFIFSFVFGQEWRDAGVIAQIISPWYFMRLIASPLGNIAMIKNKQKKFFIISTVMNLILPMLFLFNSWRQYDYKNTFIIASLFMVFYLIIIVKWVLVITGNKRES